MHKLSLAVIVNYSPLLLLIFSLLTACSSREKGTIEDPLEFTGRNIYVNMITDDIPSSTFTYEFWFKTDESHEVDEVGDPMNGAKGQRFVLLPIPTADEPIRGTGVSVGINGVSVYEHGIGFWGARIVYDGNISGWTHVAVVYKNNAPSLYVNGELKGYQKPGKDIVESKFSIAQKFALNDFFIGSIDELRVWNRALSQNEIKSNMNTTLIGDEDGLEFYYDFNGKKDQHVFYNIAGYDGHAYRVYIAPEFQRKSGKVVVDWDDNSGGSGQSIDISIPEPTNNIQFSIDKGLENETTLEIVGWAFIKRYSSENTQIYICLKSNSGKYVYSTVPVKRPDVTAHFGNLNLDDSGFKATLTKKEMKPGSYQVALLVTKDDTIKAFQYTSNSLNISP